MKFLDTINVKVRAGKGGNGCVSFRREKFVPKGGPDGGNGGDGGNIVLVGDEAKYTLLDLNYMSSYAAADGNHGRGKDQHGSRGKDLEITVPLGTVVKDSETNNILGDITKHGQKLTVAKGGKGGKGNMSFANSTRRAPRISEDGENGEKRKVYLELKLIADVGIIGLPNTGKSTFIKTVSAARPKIADYPFTTITPNLGVVKNKTAGSFVLADMPGLIEGAHKNTGLGIRFLKHIERTKILVHFIDSSDETSIIERYRTIRNEISLYSDKLACKKEIIVLTKIDAGIEENIGVFEEYAEKYLNSSVQKISSVTGKGIDDLLHIIWEELKE